MKKTVAIILAICLAVVLLCACGSRSATDGNALATDGNALATDGNAAESIPTEPAPTDAPTPEPPMTYQEAPSSVEGESAALPVDGELSGLLLAIRDEHRPGTAGSSLTAIRLAAQIMEWYGTVGSTHVAVETMMALGDPGADAAGNAYVDKLEAVYSTAVNLWGYYGEMALADCGYTPACYPYEMSDVREVFDALYSGLGYGAGAPVYVRVFRSDDNAERFMVSGVKVGTLSPENVIQSLKDVGVLNEEVAIQGMFNMENNGILIDLNQAFLDQLRTMGTTGEYMLVGALVNTFLQNYSADNLLLTVDGVHPESGHVIYDFPMTFYEDNVAEG